MQQHGGGAIVNVASEWGLNGEANHVAYCASKGAVVQITRCMALDHARDRIRVNSVCPGEIHTRMVDEILAKKGVIPSRICASWPPASRCGAWLQPARRDLRAVSWHRSMRAT